jgi:hypothetical protein
MNAPRAGRLVEAALRCYPARWRRRHADEAAELAMLLIRDGTPARSIAWSYLAGAAREWLTPRPGRRLSVVACALLVAVCSLGVSVALVASTQPARAVVSPSRPPAPAHCVPIPASHAPNAAPATDRPQPANREPGHDRPC